MLLVVAGCGGHGSSNEGISGPPPQIIGHLVGIGGPAPGAPRHWPGTVTLTDADGASTTVHTDAHGGFTVPAMSGPGHYALTGLSPRYGDGTYLCHGARAIDIGDHETIHVNVLCQLR